MNTTKNYNIQLRNIIKSIETKAHVKMLGQLTKSFDMQCNLRSELNMQGEVVGFREGI